jgi:hypothetical protein
MSNYKVEDEANKLTIEEMNGYDMYKDIDQAFAERQGKTYTGGYVRGLPFGLKLSNETASTNHRSRPGESMFYGNLISPRSVFKARFIEADLVQAS